MSKTRLIQACGAVALALGVANTADAGLTIDLRLADNPAGLGPKGGQLEAIEAAALVGQKLPINIWAIVRGTESNPDFYGFQSVHGSFLSNGVDVTGDLQGVGDKEGFGLPTQRKQLTSIAPYNAESSQRGVQQDLDGDGDLDLGAPPGGLEGDNGAAGFFIARAAGQQFNGSGNSQPAEGGGLEFLIGRLEFTVTGIDATGNAQTFINFVPRQDLNGEINSNAGLWFEVDGGRSPSTSSLTGGVPIVLDVEVIPEPGMFGLLGLGTLGLLGRRRK